MVENQKCHNYRTDPFRVIIIVRIHGIVQNFCFQMQNSGVFGMRF